MMPQKEDSFAQAWREMIAANGWPVDFTLFDFMLTLGRYATSRSNSDVSNFQKMDFVVLLHVMDWH